MVINSDVFRLFHPRFKEIRADIQAEGIDINTIMGRWSSAMSDAIFKRAVGEKRNITIEVSFETPEIPIKTLKYLKQNGYETTVGIQTCPQEESYQNIIAREKNKKQLF